MINQIKQNFFQQGECGGVGSAVVSTQGVTVSCSIQASVSLASDAVLVDVEIEPSLQLLEKDADDYNNLLLTLFTKEFYIKRENLRCRNTADEPLPLEWQLHVSVKVLSLEGSLLDSVVCAIGAALADVKLPSIVLNHASADESAIEKSQILVDDRTMHRLRLEEPLMACTFGIFVTSRPDEVKTAEVLLLAPTTEALSVCSATCLVIVGKDDEMVMVRERGTIAMFRLLDVRIYFKKSKLNCNLSENVRNHCEATPEVCRISTKSQLIFRYLPFCC